MMSVEVMIASDREKKLFLSGSKCVSRACILPPKKIQDRFTLIILLPGNVQSHIVSSLPTLRSGSSARAII